MMSYSPKCSVTLVKAHTHILELHKQILCENNYMITNKCISSDDWVQNLLVNVLLDYLLLVIIL